MQPNIITIIDFSLHQAYISTKNAFLLQDNTAKLISMNGIRKIH